MPPPSPAPAKMPNPTANKSPRSGCHRFFCRLHECGRCAALLGIFIVAPLVALWLVGLPGAVVNRLLANIQSQPYVLTAERLGFEPRHGFVLHQVLVYPTNSFAEPVARAARFVIKPRISALFRGRFEPSEILVEDAALFPPQWTRPPEVNLPDSRPIPSNGYAVIKFDGRQFTVASFTAELFSLRFNASGVIKVSDEPSDTTPAQRFAEYLADFSRSPRLVAEGFNLGSEVTAQNPPRVEVEFSFAPTGRQMNAHFSTSNLVVRGEQIDAVRADVEVRDNVLYVRDAHVSAGGGEADATVMFDWIQDIAELDVNSALPPHPLQALLFRPTREILEHVGVSDGEGLHINAHLGPADTDQLLDTLKGAFSFKQLIVRGVVLSSATGQLAGATNQTFVSDVRTKFGAQKERGTGHGDFVWHREERRIEGSIKLQTDPNDFIPFVGSNVAHIIQRFSFDKPLPHFIGTFQKDLTNDDPVIAGTLAATNFSYRGVPLAEMQTELQYSNHILELDAWRFTQTTGETRGALTMDLRADLATVNLESTMNPIPVSALVGPGLYSVVSTNRFDGPTHIIARGVVDMSEDETNTDLIVDAEGQKLGHGPWSVEEASFTIHALGPRYFATNIIGRAYDGDLCAEVTVEPLTAGPDKRYVSSIVISNAELSRITTNYAHRDKVPTGHVFLDLQLTGLVSEAIGPNTRGGGKLVVKNGTLFDLPILGGLSELLSKIIPGLGFASQTDMECTLTIADGAITTDDLRLSGDILSIKASGYVEFDGRLNIRAQVQLLRKGPIAALLRLITLPVTKLFEFQLTGTLEQPKWRPVNLPKELFLIFD